MYEGIGEPYIDKLFRELLMKHNVNYVPPGAVRHVDYIISEEMIILELEDTLQEVYNAIAQIKDLIGSVSKAINCRIVIALPIPRFIELILSPLQRFFIVLSHLNLIGELWLLDFEKDRIIKILLEKINPSSILRNISAVIKVKTNDKYEISEEDAREFIRELRNKLG